MFLAVQHSVVRIIWVDQVPEVMVLKNGHQLLAAEVWVGREGRKRGRVEGYKGKEGR